MALASRLDNHNQSLFNVMLPRASRLAGAAAMRRYQQQALRGGLALAAGLGLVALLAQPAIVLLYGARYTEAAPIFLALLGVVVFDLATSALFLIALPLRQPRVLALADWLRVGVLGAAGWALIPLYGVFGAVGARFLARVTGTVVTLWTLRRALGRLPAEENSEF
jgi:O-antigen/teichoic acid export membrane protein